MRVLHVIGGLGRGGAETMLMNLFRHIDRNQFQWDFLVYGKEIGDYESEVIQLGGKVIRIEKSNCNILRFFIMLTFTLKRNGPYDVIHIHTLLNSGTVALAGKIAKIPMRIVHSHSSEKFSCGPIYLSYEKLMKFLIRKTATKYVACSNKAAQYLFGKNMKYEIFKNAIDISKFKFEEDNRKKYRLKLNLENKFVIGHVGSFTKVKNHEFIIDIFRSVAQLDENAVLLLVGKGELEKEIKDKVEKYGLKEKVLFMRNCSNIGQLLNVFDFFVFPSFFEGLPMALVEAQANSLKCLISETISHEVAITNQVMFLGIDKSPKQWAETIIKYKKYTREDMSKKMESTEYDIKKSVKFLETIYLNDRIR